MADQLGVSQPTVYKHLRRLGFNTAALPRRYRAAKKFEFSKKEKLRIIQLAQEGKKITEIALELRKTLGPTRRVFSELGLRTSNFKAVVIGKVFGYLEVVGHAEPLKTYKGHFESRCLVKCHCGT